MDEEGDTARLGPSSSEIVVSTPPEGGADQPEIMSRRDDSTLEWLTVQSVCTVSTHVLPAGRHCADPRFSPWRAI